MLFIEWAWALYKIYFILLRQARNTGMMEMWEEKDPSPQNLTSEVLVASGK